MPLLAQQVTTSYGLMASVKLPVIQKPYAASGAWINSPCRIAGAPETYAASGAAGQDLKCARSGIAYLLSRNVHI